MGPLAQDGLDELGGVRPDLGGPADEPRGTPLQIPLVRPRAVVRIGDVLPAAVPACMACAAPAAVKDLHGVGSEPQIHARADERVWDAVVIARAGDVVVNADLRLFPLGELVRSLRQRAQGRSLERFAQRAPAARVFLERPRVEPVEQRPEGGIALGQGRERLVPEDREQPALRDLDAHFRFGAITWMAGSGGHNGRPVCAAHSAYVGLSSGSYQEAVLTPARRLSGMTSAGTPPRNSSARVWPPIQDGRSGAHCNSA
jgi:hypothetical protein